jgi:deazaflavin-dependent oxidoreductase (nitroreductase family)
VPSVRSTTRIVVGNFSRSAFFRRFGPTIMPPLERVTRVVNRGRSPLSGALVPSLVLHTIGAKSGLERDIALMYCPEPPDRLLIVGSNFGRADHPAWTLNLLANPDAAVTVKGRRRLVRAVLITDDERDAVWDHIQQQWPNYRLYEATSSRELRIFRLTPVEQAKPGDAT